jgi:nitrate reductase gamma subunit
MKKLFWIGLAVILISFVCGFLSGATNGPENAPLVSFIYGTNQIMWLFFGVIGIVLALVGGIGAIVQKIKSRKTA